MLFLFPLLLVGMFLETLSVGMVIPAIGLLLEPNYLQDYSWAQSILESLGNPTEKQRVTLGLVALAVVFVDELGQAAQMHGSSTYGKYLSDLHARKSK